MQESPLSAVVDLSSFTDTLPASYRERFSAEEIAVHRDIVDGRGGALVSAGKVPWSDATVTALCISAQDRPGLLAVISRALAELGYQVRAAEAFCRTTTPKEALDFFWLWDEQQHISDEDVSAFVDLLEQTILGHRPTVPPAVGPAPAAGTTVRFIEDTSGTLSVLEVETTDRSGLLWAITQALHKSKVQIIGSQIRTEGLQVLDRFTIEEITGEPISDERRWQIQVAVLSALEI